MIVLDTDVVSAIMRAEPAVVDWLNRQPTLSVWTTAITIFEIRYGLSVMPSGRRRSVAERAFENVLEQDLSGRILPFDRAAADEAAHLTAIRRQGGRIKEARDSMIAGIALAQGATLVTRNLKHYDDLRVPVVDPWQA
jgi:predicted nucleic acid-binding protein